MALDLPVSVLGMVGLVTVTQVLIRLTDVLSMQVLGNFQDDISEFGAVVASLQTPRRRARRRRSWCSSSASSPCSPG